jgi:hypothetical protein
MTAPPGEDAPEIGIDWHARIAMIPFRRPLDIETQWCPLSFAVIKHLAATIMGVEVQKEIRAQAAARAGPLIEQ